MLAAPQPAPQALPQVIALQQSPPRGRAQAQSTAMSSQLQGSSPHKGRVQTAQGPGAAVLPLGISPSRGRPTVQAPVMAQPLAPQASSAAGLVAATGPTLTPGMIMQHRGNASGSIGPHGHGQMQQGRSIYAAAPPPQQMKAPQQLSSGIQPAPQDCGPAGAADALADGQERPPHLSAHWQPPALAPTRSGPGAPSPGQMPAPRATQQAQASPQHAGQQHLYPGLALSPPTHLSAHWNPRSGQQGPSSMVAQQQHDASRGSSVEVAAAGQPPLVPIFPPGSLQPPAGLRPPSRLEAALPAPGSASGNASGSALPAAYGPEHYSPHTPPDAPPEAVTAAANAAANVAANAAANAAAERAVGAAPQPQLSATPPPSSPGHPGHPGPGYVGGAALAAAPAPVGIQANQLSSAADRGRGEVNHASQWRSSDRPGQFAATSTQPQALHAAAAIFPPAPAPPHAAEDAPAQECPPVVPKLPSISLTRPPPDLPPQLRAEYEADNGDLLGEGAFAVVRCLRRRRTGELVALKVVEKYPLHIRNMLPQLQREVRIQSNLRHRNILNLYLCVEDDAYVYMLLEHCPGGSLRTMCSGCPNRRLPEHRGAWYFAQILQGVEWMHQHSCVHRDLKPENMLLTADDEVRICDFGWSAEVQMENTLRTTCGTPHYWAPEIFEGLPQDFPVDLWALGTLVYELLIGHAPFWGTMEELRRKVLSVDLRYPPGLLSNEAINLFYCLLQREPRNRIPCNRLLVEHPWVRAPLMSLAAANGVLPHGTPLESPSAAGTPPPSPRGATGSASGPMALGTFPHAAGSALSAEASAASVSSAAPPAASVVLAAAPALAAALVPCSGPAAAGQGGAVGPSSLVTGAGVSSAPQRDALPSAASAAAVALVDRAAAAAHVVPGASPLGAHSTSGVVAPPCVARPGGLAGHKAPLSTALSAALPPPQSVFANSGPQNALAAQNLQSPQPTTPGSLGMPATQGSIASACAAAEHHSGCGLSPPVGLSTLVASSEAAIRAVELNVPLPPLVALPGSSLNPLHAGPTVGGASLAPPLASCLVAPGVGRRLQESPSTPGALGSAAHAGFSGASTVPMSATPMAALDPWDELDRISSHTKREADALQKQLDQLERDMAVAPWAPHSPREEPLPDSAR